MAVDQLGLTGVKETMLFTLYCRAVDAESDHPILADPYAVDVLNQLYRRVPLKIRLAGADRGIITLRAKRLDDWARDFLATHPDAVVLHLACGLDSRAFRLDVPDTVDWYDLDFPETIDVRTALYPSRPGYHTIAASVTDSTWLADLPTDRPLLMIAEGLLMYLPISQVKALLTRLTDHFPTGQLQFDVIAGWIARLGTLTDYTIHWGTDTPRDLERWNPALSLTADAPVFADHALVPQPLYRAAYHALAAIPSLRGAFRPLRFEF